MGAEHLRGTSYLSREGAATTYREARSRARALKPRNWSHYLALAVEHGLPTQPQTLWPEQWESGGRHAGFLGHGASHESVSSRGLLSATEIRERLQIGHATWKLLAGDLRPTAHVGHKTYFDPVGVREHMLTRLDQIVRSDARKALSATLLAWVIDE